jgi:hypothetical protein
MKENRRLELVRDLTRAAGELFFPEKMGAFEGDFSAWALGAGAEKAAEPRAGRLGRQTDAALDTMLVAGMFFQVLVEAERQPGAPDARVNFVRGEVKNYLVNRLAGKISLDQFFRLITLIDEKAGYYFDRLRQDWLGSREPPRGDERLSQAAVSPLQEEELHRALMGLPLPAKGNRKLSPEGLRDFLRERGGSWFKLLDFESRFQVNKKTAWSYLRLLQEAGILVHNQEKANRVRYSLAAPYLRS